MGTIRVVDRQRLRARGPSEEWRADQWLNGAIGLAQCAELTWQLRGEAEARQVDGARVALQHNLGLGGAAVVTLYRRDV